MRQEERFKRDLRALMPGDRMQYHRGNIAVARMFLKATDEIAKLVYNLSVLGYVIIWQKRDAEGVMTYNLAVGHERVTRSQIEEAERLQ